MPELCTRCYRPTTHLHTHYDHNGAAAVCAVCLIVLVGTLDGEGAALTLMVGAPAEVTT